MEECRGCLPGNWLGGVFLLLAHCEHKELFLLRPGEEPPEDRNGAVALVSFTDYFNHGDGAVHGTVCFSLPYSREITHFLTLLSAARSNSTVNDTSSKLPNVMVLSSLMLV